MGTYPLACWKRVYTPCMSRTFFLSIVMTSPTGRANPDDQKRIEELRQHIQELVDEMTFYQIRWDSLAREGNPDAYRELRFFDETFNELEAEILDLENQLHELENKTNADQRTFTVETAVDKKAERQELIKLQKEELQCIEELDELLEKETEGFDVEAKLTEIRFKLDYLRKEINAMREHG